MSNKPMLKWTRGFSLIEVMVVVVILGILAALVVPRIISRPEEAKITKAKQDVLSIQTAMDLYRLDNGFYPSTDQGIKALVTKPTSDPVPQNWKSGGYLRSVPKDPWDRPYRYVNLGSANIEIFTYGADNKPGGTGSNATISNIPAKKSG